MYNPITFIKDVIDLLRTPPGEAVAAMEITSGNRQFIVELDPRTNKYAKNGDFFIEFETMVSICPREEFFKHYEFIDEPSTDRLTKVRTIKPL